MVLLKEARLNGQVRTVVLPIVVHPHEAMGVCGWRWAVHFANTDWADMRHVLNAGLEPTLNDAKIQGERVAVAVVKAFRAYGINAAMAMHELLDTDPVPKELYVAGRR